MKPIAAVTLAIIGAALPSCGTNDLSNKRQIDQAVWSRTTSGLEDFLDQVEALDPYPPGAALIVVTTDGDRFIRVHGVLNAVSQAPATAESGFYIASITKGYMGVLAERLDQKGVLALDSTLAEHWPDVTWPESVDPAGVTMADLINHQIPMDSWPIGFFETLVKELSPEEMRYWIERDSEGRDPGFKYSNFGYYLYASILQDVTGHSWRHWLEEEIFQPLDLKNTSTRHSDFPADAVSWSHQRTGDSDFDWPNRDGFYANPPKPDATMHPAGGITSSPEDIAEWLHAQLRGEFAGIQEARQRRVEADQNTGIQTGFNCTAYAMGWQICSTVEEAQNGSVAPIPVFMHQGGWHLGNNALMTVSPEAGIAVAYVANSDSVTYRMSYWVTALAFDLLRDLDGTEAQKKNYVDRFLGLNDRYIVSDVAKVKEARADENWQGWTWEPNAEELVEYAGRYTVTPEFDFVVPAEITITTGEGELIISHHAFSMRAEPATQDLFGASRHPYDRPDAFRFIRDDQGRITGVSWDEDIFSKADEGELKKGLNHVADPL